MKTLNSKKTITISILSLVFLAVSVLLNGCKKDEKSSVVNKTNTSLKLNADAKTLAKHDTIGPPKATSVKSTVIIALKDTIGPPKK